jgi:two-component system CheB/CheR fusion protein
VHANAASGTHFATRLISATGLFVTSPDAVIVCGQSGSVVDVNPAAEILFGYSIDEIKGKPIAALIGMEGLSRLQKSAPEPNSKRQHEITVLLKDGKRQKVDAVVAEVLPEHESGPPLKLIILRTIAGSSSSDCCTKLLVKESESRFRRMADAVPVLIWQSDMEGLRDYFNHPWLAFTGRSLEQELGNGWMECLYPEDIDCSQQIYNHAFGLRKPFQTVYRLKRYDGQYRWLLDNGAPRYALDGKFEGYVGTCIDITEHKILEETLRMRSEELILAGYRKDQFLAMLSHELRNPLVPIMSSIAVMRTFNVIDPLFVKSLTIIQRQTDHLRDVINDLLDVARVANGKITVNKVPICLDQVIDRAVEISHPKIAIYGHTLKISKLPGQVHLAGDLVRLAQALSNVLHNAAKFTPSAGLITLTAGTSEGQVILTVSDNGVGISKDFQPRMFELFAQADESLARTESGLGIGLAIAREIAMLHGGSIEAHSDGPGCGSKVTLYLPALADCIPEKKRELQNTRLPMANHDYRILLIDDNLDATESMGSLLKLLHYDVRTAQDAETGLQAAATFKPHLILSDIGLPGMDGYQLAPALRKVAGTRKMTLAAVTGYGLASDRARSLAAGFDYHLVKPLDADFLLDFVAQQVAFA